MSDSTKSAATSTNWHEDAFFGLHYDLHAGAGDKVLGRDLTVEHLVERLSRVMPDWIQCDCKGHPGYTSWPTEVGSTSPGMVQDALRMHREATRQLGIPLGMHYSGVWDSRAVELHPDWARVDEDGVPDGPNRPAPKEGQKTTISSRSDSTCRLGPYDRELMIPQMLELVEKYDVDGFWVDGENWASKPCYCDRCTTEYTRRTGNSAIPRTAEDEGWDAWLGFHRDLFEEHVTAYADAIHAAKPTCMICSNWMYTMRQPDPIRAHVDYLSGDFDWTWGADRAAVEGRLLDSRGLPWDLMAWAFTKTGTMQDPPPWVMKSPLHLSQECSEVVALGGAVMIYNTPQRAGRLTDWHQDTLAEVADFCRARKELCFKSETVPQVAILHLSQHLYAHNQPLFNNGTAAAAIEGALHALLETQHPVDILPEDAALERMNRYPLVVVPERTRPSAAIQAALLAYAEKGGTVLLTGTNLNRDYPDLVAPAKDGPSERDGSGDPAASTIYLPTGRRAVPISGHWQAGHVDGDTESWLEYLRQQEPARDGTGNAAVTARRVGAGKIVAVHGPIFENYFIGHYPRLRDVVRELIAKMEIPWIVEADGPARLEVILRRKDGKLRVNLINRGSGEALSPRRVAIEEIPPIEHVTLHVRLDERPAKIGLFPENRPLEWQYSDGVATIRVDQVDIHSVVSIG